MESLIEVLLSVTQLLDELNIPYLVGGSVASSLQGFPRLTNDADIVADIQLNQVPKLFAALKDEFYVDEQAIRVAVIERRSFNVIHYDSVFKIDVYLPDEFGQQQLKHRRPEILLTDSQQETYISMPEDTILSKLSWYRRGGEVSQRQLADVAGIIKVQGQKLDLSYLREWADKLNVRDLLEKVLEESR
ncbi:MAG: nucleotidyltransferase family protein [Acidobacteriota bacterium]|nr:nucleotidyltransferase family protein [Acidobacteriota bacterium]